MILTVIAVILIIFAIIGPIVQKHNKKKNQVNIPFDRKEPSEKKYIGSPTHDNPEAWIEERAKHYDNGPGRSRYGNRSYNGHVHTAEYENYIHSSAWRSRRQRALQLGHYRCAKCGSTTSLQVHHLSYQHLGHELDNELVVLCASCHRQVHNHSVNTVATSQKTVSRASSKPYKRKHIAYNPYIRKHLFPKPYRKKSIFYKPYKKRKRWF